MAANVTMLSWGVKQSFRSYVEATGGVIEAGGGAERTADGGFTFAPAPGGDLRVGADGKLEGRGTFAGELVRSRTFRRLYTRERTAPADVLASINTILHERQLEPYFCALCYLAFDLKRRVVTIANSGLPYPLRITRGACEVIDLPGVPLGIFDRTVYEERTFQLLEGDVYVACSDGVLEAATEDGEEFGRQRLIEVLSRVAHQPAVTIVDAIYDAVVRHAGGVRGDDITAVAVRITA